ncbi:MAG: hypothetical protein PUB69_07010 [Desulfovibrionaceae bacterium]|nr:hypothetical protein [Desulfovibrionaceae bacterium]
MLRKNRDYYSYEDIIKQSLLAHKYARIKGSQEDVATVSLQYLLSSYAELRESFNVLISEKQLDVTISPEVNYLCQVTGKNGERPDIAGFSANREENVLCEVKFFAGLTDNQPR